MSTSIPFTDEDSIRELLLGHTVTKVNDYTLTLDDGRILIIEGNQGCGGCAYGWYDVTELNECPVNAIMAVEFIDEGGSDAWDIPESFMVFVLAEDRRIKLWQVEGSDNGYYGSGYWIRVKEAQS